MTPLPLLARWLLALVPLGDRRSDICADLTELFSDRRTRYGVFYAHRRLAADLGSVCVGSSRGGSMFQDLRFGLRLMRKHPLAISIAIGGLALAIGMVTSAFSVLNATLLRPYKMADPSSAVSIARSYVDQMAASWPYADFVQMRDRARLVRVEASSLESVRFGTTADSDTNKPLFARYVSGGFMATFGASTTVGRSILASDDVPSAPAVVAVSHYFWRTVLGSNPSVVGTTIWLNGSPATIVGVISRNFEGPVSPTVTPSFWLPFSSFDEIAHGRPFGPATNELVDVVGRLAPATSIAAAQDEVRAIVMATSQRPGGEGRTPRAPKLFSASSPSSGENALENYAFVAVVLLVCGLVLALACANAANLLLAGAATRTREVGLRLALGASRRQIFRQLLSEGALLGVMAGGLGLVLSLWLVPLLGRMLSLAPATDLTIDARVLVFCFIVALMCGLGASLAPARLGARGDLVGALKSQGRSGGASRVRLRMSFLGFQSAVAILLLVTALLLTRTTLVIAGKGLGFDVDSLLTVSLELPRKGFDQATYFRSALDVVRQVPGVESVSLAQTSPFGWFREYASIESDRDYTMQIVRADATYFRTTGVRVLRGRAFTDAEVADEAPVALISESAAKRFFGTSEPIGRPLSDIGLREFRARPATIIGVVADALIMRVSSKEHGALYRTPPRAPDNPPVILIRTRHPAAMTRPIEAALLTLNAQARPTSTVVADRANSYFDRNMMMAQLSTTIALLSIALALLGVYGVTSFMVSQRAHEVGIRVALGASARDVVGMLVRQSLRPVLIGLGVGLLATFAAGPILASLIGGIGPRDPISMGGGVLLLVVGALAAVVPPAMRASRVDPSNVLRAD